MPGTRCLKLSNGTQMPIVGFGTWQSTGDEVKKAVNSALEAGYRLIDTAVVYGNESAIGEVLKDWFTSGRLKRQDVFITSKTPPWAQTPEGASQSVKYSLQQLQLDYIDLYLIHTPFGFQNENFSFKISPDGGFIPDPTTDHIAIWKVLEGFVKTGQLKSIGLSNFNEKQIERVFNASEIKPANLQVELHVLFQQKALVSYCKSKGMTVTSYSTLGTKSSYDIYRSAGIDKDWPDVLNHPTVLQIAKRLERTPAQILLRFIVDKGIAVIPKSTNPGRIAENFQLFDFTLPVDVVETLNQLDRGEDGRLIDFQFLKGSLDHPEYPFKQQK